MKDMKITLTQQSASSLGALESLESDHKAFLESGGNPKNAKLFDNVINTPVFPISLTQVAKSIIHFCRQ